jgi:hypothetical protein
MASNPSTLALVCHIIRKFLGARADQREQQKSIQEKYALAGTRHVSCWLRARVPG